MTCDTLTFIMSTCWSSLSVGMTTTARSICVGSQCSSFSLSRHDSNLLSMSSTWHTERSVSQTIIKLPIYYSLFWRSTFHLPMFLGLTTSLPTSHLHHFQSSSPTYFWDEQWQSFQTKLPFHDIIIKNDASWTSEINIKIPTLGTIGLRDWNITFEMNTLIPNRGHYG